MEMVIICNKLCGIFQESAAAVAAEVASLESLKLLQKVSDVVAKRRQSAVSNDAAVSDGTSEGRQKSASSAAKLTDAVLSSDSRSTRNLSALDGSSSSPSSAGHPSHMIVDYDMLRVSEPSSVSTHNTDYQSKPSYPRWDIDNPADISSHVLITTKDYLVSDETGTEHMESTVEAITEELSNAEDTDSHTPTDNVVKQVTDNFRIEENKAAADSRVPVADVEVAEDVMDDIDKGTTLAQVSRYTDCTTATSSNSLADLPTSQASIDTFDVLSPSELPSPFQIKTKVHKEENLEFILAEPDHDSHDEWPTLPTEDELKISDAELELSIDEYGEDKDTELHKVLPQHDGSPGTESGMLTKLGASEKVLTQAARLRDIDSMHRFK